MELTYLPKVVLVVAAHADDNEFCFGGTIAKWIKQGAEVHYLVVTDGRRGTTNANDDIDELVKTRQAEQHKAAEILGVKTVTCLDYEDGRMQASWDLKRDIAKKIRELKPDTVMCMDPSFYYSQDNHYINHHDHRTVGLATFDAVYPLARDETAFDELKDMPTHKVSNLMMFNPNNEDCFTDITSEIEIKISACKAHSSQFGDGERVSEMIKQTASKCGKKADCNMAEGVVWLKLT